MALTTPGPLLPAATRLLHAAAACVSEVLVGSGALAAFCVNAEQHLAKLCAGAPLPVGFFTEADAEAAGGSSGASTSGAVGVGTAAGAAEGRGGGGSSFLHPM